MKRSIFAALLVVAGGGAAHARPLFTEEVATIGKRAFEASFSVSQRLDQYGFPVNDYETVQFPFGMRFGFHDRFDLGFTLSYVSHHIDVGSARFKGSSTGRFAPEVKFRFNDYLGLWALWQFANSENSRDELPLAYGNDYQLTLLAKAPTAIPIHFNSGYEWKGHYDSRFGIRGTNKSQVQPGDIFTNRLSLEIPVGANISVLGELAHYLIGTERVNGVTLAETDGEAMDAVAGLTWAYKGWNIGAGAAFGLLGESHTSFDTEKGAGDVTYQLSVAYRLVPNRPAR